MARVRTCSAGRVLSEYKSPVQQPHTPASSNAIGRGSEVVWAKPRRLPSSTLAAPAPASARARCHRARHTHWLQRMDIPRAACSDKNGPGCPSGHICTCEESPLPTVQPLSGCYRWPTQSAMRALQAWQERCNECASKQKLSRGPLCKQGIRRGSNRQPHTQSLAGGCAAFAALFAAAASSERGMTWARWG